MARGRYNQLQGDEHRPSASAFVDRLADNELIEGPDVTRLKALAKRKNWTGFSAHTQKMKANGVNKARIDSIVSQAMNGIKL